MLVPKITVTGIRAIKDIRAKAETQAGYPSPLRSSAFSGSPEFSGKPSGRPAYLSFGLFHVASILALTIATVVESNVAKSVVGKIPAGSFEPAAARRAIIPVGNRVTTVAGVPNDPMTYYVGAASGGVWKTLDGGLNWKPILREK